MNLPALRKYVMGLPQVREGVTAVADDIAGEARRLAPVRTGQLRDSITTRRTVRKGEEGDTVRVEANTYYAQFVELGTRNMAARPFLRPAAARYRQNRGGHFAAVTRRRSRRSAARRAAGQ
jgi:HK97 gp10 family phage protein